MIVASIFPINLATSVYKQIKNNREKKKIELLEIKQLITKNLANPQYKKNVLNWTTIIQVMHQYLITM